MLTLPIRAVSLDVPGGPTSIAHRGLCPSDGTAHRTASSSYSSHSSPSHLLHGDERLQLMLALLPGLPSTPPSAPSSPPSGGRDSARGDRQSRLSAILCDQFLSSIHPLADREGHIYPIQVVPRKQARYGLVVDVP